MSTYQTTCCGCTNVEGIPSPSCCDLNRAKRGLDIPEYPFASQRVFYNLERLCCKLENLHDGVLYAHKAQQTREEYADLLAREANKSAISSECKALGRFVALELLRHVGRQRANPYLGSFRGTCCEFTFYPGVCGVDGKLCLGEELKHKLETSLKEAPQFADKTIKALIVSKSEALQYRADIKLSAQYCKELEEDERMKTPKESISLAHGTYNGVCAVGTGTVKATVAVAKVATSPFRMLRKGLTGTFGKTQQTKKEDSWFVVNEFNPTEEYTTLSPEDTNYNVGCAGEVQACLHETLGVPGLSHYFCSDVLMALKKADNHLIFIDC